MSRNEISMVILILCYEYLFVGTSLGTTNNDSI